MKAKGQVEWGELSQCCVLANCNILWMVFRFILQGDHTLSLGVLWCLCVEFLIIVWAFHCPQTTALSKAFLSYIIALYWVASFVVVRHHQLGLDYWAAIFVSARLYCALQVWRRTLSWNTSWWCVRGWRQETGYFSWRMRSLTFPIYVWPFGPSLWIISKNDTASRSCA